MTSDLATHPQTPKPCEITSGAHEHAAEPSSAYRKSGDYLGKSIPKLGFGLMRLPHLADGSADLKQIEQMVDAFMVAGLTYFDTARSYGDSEANIRRALVERYPRSSYQLATKNFAFGAKSAQEARGLFDQSLSETGAQYFDFYLLHNLGEKRTQAFEDFGMWDFVRGLKEDGKVRHIGFSFHDTADALEALLEAHPEAEFVQLQINYADWESGYAQSRKCYELARAFGKPVVIMEPIKGGMLANLPEPVREILDSQGPQMTPAEWALRFAMGLDGVITVLSGMSTLEQVHQNISTWAHFKPLDSAQRNLLAQAQRKLAEIIYVPCTACKYCVKTCPQSINIPAIFESVNRNKIYGGTAGKNWYGVATKAAHKASDCIGCGRCEEVCPQGIDVRDALAEAARIFE